MTSDTFSTSARRLLDPFLLGKQTSLNFNKGAPTHNPTENKPDTWRLAIPSPHEPSNLNNLTHHQPA